MFRRPPAAARPSAARAASWLAALALLLRLLLPALHHHHDHHGHGLAHGPAACAPCSCGQVHERAPARGDAQLDAAPVAAPHFCLACEVELGTPGACAELPPPLPAPQAAAALRSPRTGRIAALAAGRRPPTRAPPAQRC